MDRKFTLHQILVFIGGLLGLIAGAIIGLRRFGIILFFADPASGPQPPSGDAFAGQLAFLFVYTLPFLLSLLVLRSNRKGLQAVIWMGAGLVALAGSYSSFSAITLVLLPVPGLLLLIGGVVAFIRPEVERSLLVVSLALIFVVAGGASFLTLFMQENPACWVLVHNASGDDVWERSSPDVVPLVVVGDPGVGDVVAWSCNSDVISRTEGLSSLGIWGIVLVGLYVVDRRRVLA